MPKSISMILSALAVSAVATAGSASAQTVAGCPTAGIAVAVTSNRGTYTVKHLGPDASDRSICLADVEGQGAVFPGQRRTIYVWYDLTNFPMANSYVGDASNALAAVLSGQKNDATFDVVMGRSGKSWSWSSTEIWQRAGADTIKVGTQSTAATRLRYETKPGGGTNFHVVWDLWYDPVRHLLLKGHATALSGSPAVTDFEVTAISGP
jgi:hypothetical protein